MLRNRQKANGWGRALVFLWALFGVYPSAVLAAEPGSTESIADAASAPIRARDLGNCQGRCAVGTQCIEGRCVRQCQPACAYNERCNGRGECETEFLPAGSLESSSSLASADNEETAETEATERYSPELMSLGIVLTVLGGTVLIGAIVANQLDTKSCDSGTATICSSERHPSAAAMVIGLGLLGAGIPLTILGARRVSSNASSVSAQSAVISVGARGVAIVGSF